MNNIKKRLLCCFLMILISFGNFEGTIFAKENAENENTASENVIDSELQDALDVLRLLEIIPDYYEYNSPFETTVSRGEFVDTVANIINVYKYGDSSTYYYDVPATHFAYDSICTLTEMGILSGTEDKKFNPDAMIDHAAAYKILLGMMGYGEYMEYNGGYPNGCIAAAGATGIFVNSSSQYLTHAEMFRMIYRALDVNIYESDLSSETGRYETKLSQEDTLLSVYRKIYREEGNVKGAKLITLSETRLNKENEVLVDDISYETEFDMEPYLGEDVEFYYHNDDKNDQRTILWVKNKGKTDTLVLNVDNDAKFDENTFTYTYYGDKNKKIQLDRGLLLIYNGVAVDDNYEEIFNLPIYDVKFIKTGNVYKTAIVNAYENYVVDSVDVNNEFVYDKIDPTRVLKLNNDLYDYINITKVDGSEAAVADISSGSTLSVFLSKDKSRIRVIISVESRTGAVTGISSKNGGYDIGIGENTYRILNKNYKNNFAAGDSVKMYIDHNGYAAYISVESGSSFPAYLVSMNKTHDDTLNIKLFKSDGNMEFFESRLKITVDGKKNCSADQVIKLLSTDGKVASQLVIAKTAKDGKITSLDTATFNSDLEKKDSSLQMNMDYAERHYKIQGYFNFEAAINDQTIIFSVPMNASTADDSDYRIMRKSQFKDDTKHYVMSYNIGDDTGYEQFVVRKESSAGMDYGDELPILITGKGSKVNDDDECVQTIEGYQGNNLIEVMSNGTVSFDDLKPGMLVRLRYMRDGSVAGKIVLFDPENPQLYYTTVAPFNNIYGVEVGFVNNVIGDVIKIGYGTGANVDHVTNLFSSPVILVCDKNDIEKPYVGNFTDARRYTNVEDDCSTVVLITKHCSPRLYVFYNN